MHQLYSIQLTVCPMLSHGGGGALTKATTGDPREGPVNPQPLKSGLPRRAAAMEIQRKEKRQQAQEDVDGNRPILFCKTRPRICGDSANCGLFGKP